MPKIAAMQRARSRALSAFCFSFWAFSRSLDSVVNDACAFSSFCLASVNEVCEPVNDVCAVLSLLRKLSSVCCCSSEVCLSVVNSACASVHSVACVCKLCRSAAASLSVNVTAAHGEQHGYSNNSAKNA